MTKAEWKANLENIVERLFDLEHANGYEDSAPSIKLGILADMYDREPMDIELTKELAYDELATRYLVMSSWN